MPAPDGRQHRARRRLRAVAQQVPTHIRRTMRRVVARTGSIAAAAQQGEGKKEEEEGSHGGEILPQKNFGRKKCFFFVQVNSQK